MNNPFGKRFSGFEIKDRLDEIEDELEELNKDAEDGQNECEIADLKEERELLKDLDQDAEYIHEDYFKEHAQDVAYELMSRDEIGRWPYSCIDWEQAADELRHDYSCVEIGDETYYYRS